MTVTDLHKCDNCGAWFVPSDSTATASAIFCDDICEGDAQSAWALAQAADLPVELPEAA